MSPDLRQRVLRYKGESYTLAFAVDLGDPDANAASITSPIFTVGTVRIEGVPITVADSGAGKVVVSIVIAENTFDSLSMGYHLFELSLSIGGDLAVVAAGVYELDSSLTLEPEA